MAQRLCYQKTGCGPIFEEDGGNIRGGSVHRESQQGQCLSQFDFLSRSSQTDFVSSQYADPVLDKLDIHQVVSHRLFRESCYNHRGNYVKVFFFGKTFESHVHVSSLRYLIFQDLSQLGRPISDTIIIDNSPASYIFHPNNAVPVSSWFNDPHDTELTDLCPFLADLGQVDDVRGVLDGGL